MSHLRLQKFHIIPDGEQLHLPLEDITPTDVAYLNALLALDRSETPNFKGHFLLMVRVAD
jgi:hypothetical protein